MHEYVNGKASIAIGMAVGVSTALGLAYLYKKRLDNTPPTKWRRIGEISELICYPIKSCGPIRVSGIDCNILGLEDGHLRDRVFMVITPEGQFVTARAQPKLLLVQPNIVGSKMTLTAPGMMDHEVDIELLYKTSPIKTTVWNQSVNTIDCGEETAKWLSRFLCGEDIGVRLVFYPNTVSERDVRPKNVHYDKLTSVDSGALHDASSFMLMNEASITELNSRLEQSVTALQFRPNFMVKGPVAFEEDNWKWIKVGDSVVFRNVKPCTRCIFTNIDPETAVRNKDHEPLKTLKNYRIIHPNEPPVMGIHIGVVQSGKVSIGDAVYVEDDH